MEDKAIYFVYNKNNTLIHQYPYTVGSKSGTTVLQHLSEENIKIVLTTNPPTKDNTDGEYTIDVPANIHNNANVNLPYVQEISTELGLPKHVITGETNEDTGKYQ